MSLKLLSAQNYARRNFGTTALLIKGSTLFNGSSYLEPASGISASNFGTGDFTAEFWYRPTATGQMNCLDNFGVSTAAIYRGYDNVMRFADGGVALTSTTALTNNTWWHIAVVRYSGTAKIYINGTWEGSSGSDSTNFTGGENRPRIGLAFNGSVGVVGNLSNVRLVKAAVYTSNFTPPTSPLTAIANTSLLTCQNPDVIVDNGPNAFSMTNTGGAAASVLSPFA